MYNRTYNTILINSYVQVDEIFTSSGKLLGYRVIHKSNTYTYTTYDQMKDKLERMGWNHNPDILIT